MAAAREVKAGGLGDQFPVDVFQAGGGTSVNMNLNEVITNRALELLGHRRGEYDRLHPNDHVNMSQSSNDTFPTAAHVATVWYADDLLGELDGTALSLRAKAEEFGDLVKVGRTHLRDALPVTLGGELAAYATALERSGDRIRQRRSDLLAVPLGGTAVGTGANTPDGYRRLAVSLLSEEASVPLRPSLDGMEGLQSRAQLGALSSSLRELCLEVVRIAGDLTLLSSGPVAGLGEISLPPVQPGSSIMAGKVNPSVPECVTMVCFHVLGLDAAVAWGVQAGQLELNAMVPLIAHDVLESEHILVAAMGVLRERCLDGITAHPERMSGPLERDPVLSTLLIPRIGYRRAAEVMKEASSSGWTVKETVVRRGFLSEEEVEELLAKHRHVPVMPR